MRELWVPMAIISFWGAIVFRCDLFVFREGFDPTLPFLELEASGNSMRSGHGGLGRWEGRNLAEIGGLADNTYWVFNCLRWGLLNKCVYWIHEDTEEMFCLDFVFSVFLQLWSMFCISWIWSWHVQKNCKVFKTNHIFIWAMKNNLIV